MKRGSIEMNENVMEIVAKMSEGNPGALSIMMEILKEDPEMGIMQLLFLDDMNIWGTQIWYGYKYYCDSDIKKFIECIKIRDPEMVKIINEYYGKPEAQFEYRAVEAGASYQRKYF